MIQAVRSWVLLVAVVALCGLATPAFAHGGHYGQAQATHTTTDPDNIGKLQNDKAEVASHTHQEGAKSDAATCCGLSCMFAAPPYDPQLLILELPNSSLLVPLQPELLGRSSTRLDRPPAA
jgi:hypothetical protein